MTAPFVFIATSQIRPGKLDQECRNTPLLVAAMLAEEPSLLAFNVFVNDPGTTVSTVQVYTDADAMEFHMRVSAQGLAHAYGETRGAPISIQVFGKPNTAISEMLRLQSAAGCHVEIMSDSPGGFTRMPASD